MLLLALILHPQLGLWSWVLAGCGAVSVTLTVASVASLGRRQATPIESTSVRRRDTEVYAFTFASQQPHGYRNLGRTVAKILWVNTPATF